MSDELQKARARLVRLIHLRHLGLDPAIGRFRSNEANTANALEYAVGERLERAVGAGDWRGTRTGRIYDDCSPAPGPFFDRERENWIASLRRHAITTQGIDVVTVDIRDRGLSQAQLSEVVAALNDLPPPAQRKVLVLLNEAD
jgi:hypothetical protein